MKTHTPGPWELHSWGDASFEVLASETTVCNVPGFDDDTADAGRAEADARLIAAAPELLEALIAAKGTIEYLLANSDNGPAENCIEILAAAIAKAEGAAE